MTDTNSQNLPSTDSAELEVTQIQENFSQNSSQVAEIVATKAKRELELADKVPFNPIEDAETLDVVIQSSLSKLKQLSEINVVEELKKCRKKRALLETPEGEEPQEIELHDQEPDISEIIGLESVIAKSMSSHVKNIQTSMKERRLLSGQLYGAQQSQQISRLTQVKRAKLNGKSLLEELDKNLGLDASEDMPLVAETTNENTTDTDKPSDIDLSEYIPPKDFGPKKNKEKVIDITSPQPAPNIVTQVPKEQDEDEDDLYSATFKDDLI